MLCVDGRIPSRANACEDADHVSSFGLLGGGAHDRGYALSGERVLPSKGLSLTADSLSPICLIVVRSVDVSIRIRV